QSVLRKTYPAEQLPCAAFSLNYRDCAGLRFRRRSFASSALFLGLCNRFSRWRRSSARTWLRFGFRRTWWQLQRLTIRTNQQRWLRFLFLLGRFTVGPTQHGQVASFFQERDLFIREGDAGAREIQHVGAKLAQVNRFDIAVFDRWRQLGRHSVHLDEPANSVTVDDLAHTVQERPQRDRKQLRLA